MSIKQMSKFSLIEMLVVIAIISILSAILLPALQNALQASRTVSCMNNLKQCGMAVLSFADENNGFTPGEYGSSCYWGSYMIVGSVSKNPPLQADYIGKENREVMNCPASLITTTDMEQTYGMCAIKGGSGYDCNNVLQTVSFQTWSGSYKSMALYRISRIRSPSDWVQLTDSTVATAASFRQNTHMVYSANDLYTKGVFMCHNRMANVWMPDNHAETADTSRLTEMSNEHSSLGKGMQWQIFDDGSAEGERLRFPTY